MLMTFEKQTLIPVVLSALFAMPLNASETAGQYLDDTTLTGKTKAALVDDKTASALDLNVEVYKGHVQLSGFVDSAAEESAALAAASKVEGARKVHDAIVVLPGSRSMGMVVDDTTIQTKLKSGLAKVEGFGDAVAINTEVRQGHVLLAGFVDNDNVKSAAGKVAHGIEGVKQVHNYIAIKP